ncbi:MAG: FGGY family carbohydrate kinase [Azospirillaceae bacterium]|nr:FGGY family carbohydrate kinase [Azospirillaceae bacterium]
MSKPLILSIDLGTSSTKSLLVDRRGQVVARGSAPLGEHHVRPGWVDQDADEIWRSLNQAVRACLEGQDASAVATVGLSSQRESLVMWDRRSGDPISPVISWQDQRTVAACAALCSDDNDRLVVERSGLPLDPMFSALKAKWLLDTYDPDRRRARAGEICLGTIDSWFLSRFGGDHVTEAGNASRTQLLNVRRVDWDPDLLALFEVPASVLPRVVSSVGPFPKITGLAPLRDGTPIGAVMGDSHAALFAHGAFTPGKVKATYGTGSSVMGLVGEAEHLDPGLCLTIAWALSLDKPALAAEGNIRSAGSTLKWLADILGVSPQELATLGNQADSGGVILVPGFGGLGAPWWEKKACAQLSGFTLGTGRAELARAALDSIIQQVADLVEAIDRSVGRIDALCVDGGPTRNDALMQNQADLIDRLVLRSHTTELSALGVAHLAGLSAGLWSWDDLTALSRAFDPFNPRRDEASRVEKRRAWLAAISRARA